MSRNTKVQPGQKYGYLVVVKRVPNLGRRSRWACKCKCGKTVEVLAQNLTGEPATRSCGCLKKEVGITRMHRMRAAAAAAAAIQRRKRLEEEVRTVAKIPPKTWKGMKAAVAALARLMG